MLELDKIHGPIINTFTTDCAWVFVHKDGYREVQWFDEMEEQEPMVLNDGRG